jgi:hypothetical protein
VRVTNMVLPVLKLIEFVKNIDRTSNGIFLEALNFI